jgi:hypothetical protein
MLLILVLAILSVIIFQTCELSSFHGSEYEDDKIPGSQCYIPEGCHFHLS